MKKNDAMNVITELGFETVKLFQGAWNLDEKLEIDGILGPLTKAAAAKSWERHLARKGDISQNFSAREFRCKCTWKDCGHVWVSRSLLVGLEKLRKSCYPHGLTVVSGCRCKRYNTAVGGATHSQHLSGRAADIPGRITVDKLQKMKLFTGIGYRRSDRIVIHVDVRAGSAVTPVTWAY